MSDPNLTKLTGTEELLALMQKVSVRVQKEVALESLVVSVLPVVEAVRDEAPIDLGSLKQSIGFRLKRFKAGRHLYVVVGPRRGTYGPKGDKPAKTAHLVENGHTVKGKSGVSVPANAFTRRGWMRTKGPFLTKFTAEFTARLTRVIAATKAKRKKST